MRDPQSLVEDLESEDPSIRNKAALELMDIGDEVAVEPLLRAISKPNNINHRGTLVYALSAFNCERCLELLVDLVLTGNFEVSTGAFSILEEQATSTAANERAVGQMRRYQPSALAAEHHKLAYEALADLFQAGEVP